MLTIGIMICVFLAVAFQFDYEIGRENPIYMTYGLAFVFFYALTVYIPFTREAFILAKKLSDEEPIYKKGIQSLGIMSLCVVLMFLSFIIDQTLLIYSGIKYSFFYFAGWIFVIIGLYMAYVGYLMPGNASRKA
jgi:hypothetical protein